jgi:MOSC domain-containing protein YiiM
MTASIHQLSTSRGGVPKRAVPSAEVTPLGLAGDWQQDRRHHGGPDRAICLFPFELVERLQAEGHPITPGAVGENVTTVGVEWARMVPGTRLRLGATVELELVSYTAPCKTIRAAFADGDFARISQKVHPGESRVYARVLTPGAIRVGDPITLLEPA